MTSTIFGFIGLSRGELMLILSALFLLGAVLVSVLAVAVLILSRRAGKGTAAPPVTQVPGAPEGARTEYTNMAGTHFHKVNLSGADFDDVNLGNARFHNVRLSNGDFSAADLGGASFRHIGPPLGPDGKRERQRPVRFEEMMLCDSTFRRVDLSNVRITECDLSGMTINGVLVTDLLAAYTKHQNSLGQG
jgi:hypothetical protein